MCPPAVAIVRLERAFSLHRSLRQGLRPAASISGPEIAFPGCFAPAERSRKAANPRSLESI
jgi:hypothetical protein